MKATRATLSPAFLALVLSISDARGAASGHDVVPLFTPALEQQLQPQSPPFAAIYRKGGQRLVFIAAEHVFGTTSATTRAVDSGFAAVSPAIVIIEGFPTAGGEDPPALVAKARSRGTSEADDYARGEAMYTASVALSRGIHFIGGEPAPEEQVQGLERRGYTVQDVAFSYLLQGLGQSVRSGEVAAGSQDPKLAAAFAHWAEGFVDQYSLNPPSFEEFSARYKLMFGVEFMEDQGLAERPTPGKDSAFARLIQADMNARDEHLLTTIAKELALKKRVLVVYGSSHWITLSQALQKRLGKPTIVGFAD